MITKSQSCVRETRIQTGFTNGLESVIPGFRALLEGAVELVRRKRMRARLRRDLEHLDARLLHDIGVRREELEAEAAKPFWQR